MKRLFLALMILSICSIGHTAVVTEAYTTPDDVTVSRLESNRLALTNGINSGDGSLIQAGTIAAEALDANANPENRWNEGFNDFVFTGLTVPTSATLSSTTASGIAYVNGTRVVKDSTAKTYTASKWTWVDLSSNGTFTYSETAIDGSEPATATNSIRLAKVSSDTTDIPLTTDERVTEISIAAGSAGSVADTDADTKIQSEESTDEDILRFDLGDDTLTSAREVLTIQAIDADDVKIEPTTDNDVDLGSSTKEFKDLYIDGFVYADTVSSDTLSFGSGATVDVIRDENALTSNDVRGLATQRSIKTYVDNNDIDGEYFPNDSTVLYAFDNGTTGKDSSNLHNAVTLTSLAKADLTTCKVSPRCYTFDGSADKVAFADSAKQAGTADFSIEVWVNPDSVTSAHFIASENNTLEYKIDGANISATIGTSSGAEALAATAHGMSLQTWYHFVLTFTNGGTGLLYKNGVLLITGNGSGNGTITFNAVQLGVDTAGTGSFWAGEIDGFIMYDRVLTPAEVLARYNRFK